MQVRHQRARALTNQRAFGSEEFQGGGRPRSDLLTGRADCSKSCDQSHWRALAGGANESGRL